MDLFAQSEADHLRQAMPLAARMRPESLDEVVGQQHILGPGKLLRRMVDANRLGSLILFGPPGTGKTTLAKLLAAETAGEFRQISAVAGGVKDVREVLQWATDRVATGACRPTLFIDEIHRFSKSQQDILLPEVEAGIVSLVGATTANPFFSINAALLSRSQIFQLQPLSQEEMTAILERALHDPQRGLGGLKVHAQREAIDFLATFSEGDARRALTALEIAVRSQAPAPSIVLTVELACQAAQAKQLGYDGSGDDHYDLTSALIKKV